LKNLAKLLFTALSKDKDSGTLGDDLSAACWLTTVEEGNNALWDFFGDRASISFFPLLPGVVVEPGDFLGVVRGVLGEPLGVGFFLGDRLGVGWVLYVQIEQPVSLCCSKVATSFPRLSFFFPEFLSFRKVLNLVWHALHTYFGCVYSSPFSRSMP